MSKNTVFYSDENGSWMITDCGVCQGRGNMSVLHPSGAGLRCYQCQGTGKLTTPLPSR